MTDNIKMAVLSCNEQWCCTVIPGLIFVSTNFHQKKDSIKMAVLSCNEQWCCTLIWGLILYSTDFHQMTDNIKMAGHSALQSTMVSNRYPWPWPYLCQHQLPPNDGQHQDGHSELPFTIPLHPDCWLDFCQHRFPPMTDNIKMAILSCHVQYRCTLIVGLIFVSTNFHQITNNIKIAPLSCYMQWRHSSISFII